MSVRDRATTYFDYSCWRITVGKLTNAPGFFNYAHLGDTAQMRSEALQHSPWRTDYVYGGNQLDRQLLAITHRGNSSVQNPSSPSTMKRAVCCGVTTGHRVSTTIMSMTMPTV